MLAWSKAPVWHEAWIQQCYHPAYAYAGHDFPGPLVNDDDDDDGGGGGGGGGP